MVRTKEEVEKLMNDDRIEWNDGYWVEGLDRIHTIQTMVDSLLVCSNAGVHPSVLRAGLEDDIYMIQSILNLCYQKMAMASDKEQDNED